MSDKPQGKSMGELTMTVDADVGDALKGIKALNRELGDALILKVNSINMLQIWLESLYIEVVRANAQTTT